MPLTDLPPGGKRSPYVPSLALRPGVPMRPLADDYYSKSTLSGPPSEFLSVVGNNFTIYLLLNVCHELLELTRHEFG